MVCPYKFNEQIAKAHNDKWELNPRSLAGVQNPEITVELPMHDREPNG